MQMKHLAYAAILAATSAALVIGSGLPSQAAKKKTMAAPTHSIICTMQYVPVCATMHGMKQTYANSCFASHDNATIVSNGACGAKKAAKHHMKKMAMKKHMKKMEKPKK